MVSTPWVGKAMLRRFPARERCDAANPGRCDMPPSALQSRWIFANPGKSTGMGEKKRRLAAAASITAQISAARRLHEAGQLKEAQAAYSRVLAVDPTRA